MGTIIILILILLLIGAFPAWGYSATWGHGPLSLVGGLLVIVLVLVILGKL